MNRGTYPSEMKSPYSKGKSARGRVTRISMKPHLLCLRVAFPLFILAQAGVALAQDAPPPPPTAPAPPPTAPAPPAIQLVPAPATANPARPAIDLSTAPVAPVVQRKYHLHEGFYLRASMGLGDYRASFTD